MNKKTLMIPFIVALMLVLVSFVSASNVVANDAINLVEFNGVRLDSSDVNMAGFAGETVPVRLTFEAGVTSNDVRVELEIYGGRNDIDVKSERFNIVEGRTYTKLMNLQLPSDLRDDIVKNLTLYVRIRDSNGDNNDFIDNYSISMQRESYELRILSVDMDKSLSAGGVVPVSVVVKNTGFDRSDDIYVLVSIPELGVSSRGYLGDLAPTKGCNVDYYDNNCDDDLRDAVEKTVFLRMPSNVKPGVYEVVVKVYDRDSTTTVKELVSFGGSTSANVLSVINSQDIMAGETNMYEVIIINPSDNLMVYQIQTISGTDLNVVAPSVVTVGPKSSKTVQVAVTATENAVEGTQSFTVDVNGEKVTMAANIAGTVVSTGVVALTVVLVIIFVVLLVVLIILLSRREKPIEEVETSYY